MLFERRAYTLRPGNAARFWALQEKWNTPTTQFGDLLARNIGYFSVTAGSAEQIVHLYRFDSFDDWKARLFGTYTPERAEYFASARGLLTAQENMFLMPAPIPELNPLWGGERDWLPGTPFFKDAADATRIVVTESTLDLVPGGLPALWEAYAQHGLKAGAVATAHLIGCFYTLVGPQHRVLHYRWYRDEAAAGEHVVALERDPDWNRFVDAYRPYAVRSHVAHLRPSPVPWMRALFTDAERPAQA